MLTKIGKDKNNAQSCENIVDPWTTWVYTAGPLTHGFFSIVNTTAFHDPWLYGSWHGGIMDMEGSFLKKTKHMLLTQSRNHVPWNQRKWVKKSWSHKNRYANVYTNFTHNCHDFSPSTATHLGFHDARDARSQKNYRWPKCQGREPE